MVPKVGIEPTLPCENRILNPTRLPIPPLRLTKLQYEAVSRSSRLFILHSHGMVTSIHVQNFTCDC